jgi:D-3-phosphoglycerate dehydrogenase
MSLSRNVEGGTALTLLTLDSTPGAEVLADLAKIDGVQNLHCVTVQ